MIARILIIAVLVCTPRVSLADQPSPLTEEEIDQRLRFIEQRLDAGKPGAQRWQYGWTALFAADTAFSTIMAIRSNDGDNRAQYGVEAVKVAGALALLLLRPLPAVDGAGPLVDMPSATREEKTARLEAAEDLLRTNAKRARERTSFTRHLLAVTVHLVGSTAIAALGDVRDAAVSNLTGIAVSQVHIWTQPWRAIDDLEDYERQFPASPSAEASSWHLTPIPGGLGVTIHF